MDSTGLTTLMDAHIAGRAQRLVVLGPPPVARRPARVRPRRGRPPAGRVAFTPAMESHTVPQEPTVRIDALETFVELLSRVEADPLERRVLQPPVRGHLPARRHGPRRDLPLRRRAPAGQRRRRLRDPARRLRRRAGDGRDRPGRARVARRGPRDRDLERDGRGRARRVPRPDPRVDARVHADGRRRPLARRDPVRPRAGPPAAARLRALPAVDARQDRRAGRLRPAGDQQAGPGPPAAGAHGPRARGARVRDPAPVRDPARVLQPGRAEPRRARADRRPSCRPRCSTSGARCSARSAAPGAGDEHDAARGGRAAAQASTATCT